MEKLILNFKQGLIHGMGIVLVIGVFVFGFYLVKGVTFNEGEVITSTKLNSIVPSGFVGAFNLTTCPTGWKEANGTDSSLDLRGVFLRGLDNGKGYDAGRTLGSYQTDEFKSHNHGNKSGKTNECTGGSAGYTDNFRTGTCAKSSLTYTRDTGGTETRPKNIAVLYCIKE